MYYEFADSQYSTVKCRLHKASKLTKAPHLSQIIRKPPTLKSVGRSFKTRFSEHRPIGTSYKQKSTIAQHLVDFNHNINKIEDSMEVLHRYRIGRRMDSWHGYKLLINLFFIIHFGVEMSMKKMTFLHQNKYILLLIKKQQFFIIHLYIIDFFFNCVSDPKVKA